MRQLSILLCLIVLLLWTLPVYAQDGDQPPDPPINPPGLDYSQRGHYEPLDVPPERVFTPYSPDIPGDPNALAPNVVPAQNVAMGYDFRIRTCPTTALWCAEGVQNVTLGYFYEGAWQLVDRSQWYVDSAGAYKWYYVPAFDPDPYDGVLEGFVAVCYGRRPGCWISWQAGGY